MTSNRPAQSRAEQAAIFAVVVLGLALFVLGRLGVTVLAFDRHHLLTQGLGMVLALGALTRWR